MPHPLATTAAWLTRPPCVVRIPFDTCMPSTSSGDVSVRTRITASSDSAARIAASAVSMMRPVAAPGDAGNPSPIGSTSSPASSDTWKNSARSPGAIEFNASATATPVRAAVVSPTAVATRTPRSPIPRN